MCTEVTYSFIFIVQYYILWIIIIFGVLMCKWQDAAFYIYDQQCKHMINTLHYVIMIPGVIRWLEFFRLISIILYNGLFIHLLFGRWNERGERGFLFIGSLLIWPQQQVTGHAETRSPSLAPTWVAGTKIIGQSSTLFPKHRQESGFKAMLLAHEQVLWHELLAP